MKKSPSSKLSLLEKRELRQACGLCGKKNSSCHQTACCGNWICGNEEDYVLFSYSRKICCRNHRRFTLCGGHHEEGHSGDWKTCEKCKKMFETEMYVWYGTNEYNFEKLPDPPKFKPTHCINCNTIISLSDDGYTQFGRQYACEKCMDDGYEFDRSNTDAIPLKIL